ncbi:MAG: hypothetical protein AAF657_07980 [Acidobacteriota bacterium]
MHPQKAIYLGTENIHLESGERTRYVWLRSMQLLGSTAGGL